MYTHACFRLFVLRHWLRKSENLCGVQAKWLSLHCHHSLWGSNRIPNLATDETKEKIRVREWRERENACVMRPHTCFQFYEWEANKREKKKEWVCKAPWWLLLLFYLSVRISVFIFCSLSFNSRASKQHFPGITIHAKRTHIHTHTHNACDIE